MHLEQTPGFRRIAGKTEDQREIGLRHVAGSLFGPLDQAHGVFSKILTKAGIVKLCWFIESIKIKVIPVYARNHVNFNQRIGRALHRTGVAECAQQCAYQRRLARAKVAVEPDDHAGREQRRQLAPQRDGRRFVRQSERQGRQNRAKIRLMHEKNSTTKAQAASTGEPIDLAALVENIKDWGRELGFAEPGIARANVSAASPDLMRWLEQGCHGAMHYMAKHAALRAEPQALLPGTLSVISARLPYWPDAADAQAVLSDPGLAYVSRYALGRDYHKTLRQRLQKLAERIGQKLAATQSDALLAYRVFADSAPVMEVEFARLSGIAWRGKHSLALTRGGSWHFLGEIYCSLPLPPDAPIAEHCGHCTRCIDACPTAAIVAPYQVDARLCISYLTIELPGAIPVELRPLIGNRIYGCDDCQLCCPWNRFARIGDADFAVRHGLDALPLGELFAWSETDFASRLAGSPIRRIGHERWLRNIAVALGNAFRSTASSPLRLPGAGQGGATPGPGPALESLRTRLDHPSALVREHVGWALAQATNP